MSKLYIIQGCPASGKSTLARKMFQNRQVEVISNRDELRRSGFPSQEWPHYVYSKQNEKQVTLAQETMIYKALDAGKNVVCDDTNLSDKTINKLKRLAEETNSEVEIIQLFDVCLLDLFKRNIKREHSVPEDVILRFYRQQVKIQNRKFEINESLPNCIIVDIDGTIADMGKDQSWGRNPYEWSKVINDIPLDQNISIIKSVKNAYIAKLVFLTGRDEVCRKDTQLWLEQYFSKLDMKHSELIMKEEGSHEKSCFFKERAIRDLVIPNYNPVVAFDDSASVALELRELGLKVFQVDTTTF